MILNEQLLLQKAEAYASRHGLRSSDRLGWGVHGMVFVMESNLTAFKSAIKIFQHVEPYEKERDVYLRLRKRGVERIEGFHVPQLLSFDDDLLVIGITIVSRPYVLDFAGAFLDNPPEFSEEVLGDWLEQKRDQFGSRWGVVESLLEALRSHGVYLADVTPDNIAFVD